MNINYKVREGLSHFPEVPFFPIRYLKPDLNSEAGLKTQGSTK